MILFSAFASMILLLISCEKEDIGKEEVQPPKNTAPLFSELDIMVLKVTANTATVSCKKAFDADGDNLYYSLYLGDTIVLHTVASDILYKFENLKPETAYHGKITVTDSINKAVEASFSFTTSVYRTLFSKVFSSPLGSIGGASSIEPTSDGGYIALGGILNDSRYVYVLKIDSLGYEQWSKAYDIDAYILDGQLIETSQHSYVFVSDSNIVKINSHGDIEWQYQGNHDSYYKSIMESDGELIISGTKAQKAHLIKFTLDGDKLMEKTYLNQYDRYASSICKSNDNNYVLLGVNREGTSDNFWLMKTNIDGEMLWEKTFEDDDFAFAKKLIVTKDGGFAIVGNSMGNLNKTSARVLKTNASGELEWDRAYKWDGFKTSASGIVQTDEGDFIFCGSDGYSKTEAILVKVDATGNLIWKKAYKPEGSLDYTWGLGVVKLCNDGGFILEGNKSWTWNGSDGQEKGLWIMKTDENGNWEQ